MAGTTSPTAPVTAKRIIKHKGTGAPYDPASAVSTVSGKYPMDSTPGTVGGAISENQWQLLLSSVATYEAAHLCSDSGILKHAAEANNAAVKAIFQSTVEEDYAERGTTKQHEAGTVGGLICDGGQATAMATLCRKKGN